MTKFLLSNVTIVAVPISKYFYIERKEYQYWFLTRIFLNLNLLLKTVRHLSCI